MQNAEQGIQKEERSSNGGILLGNRRYPPIRRPVSDLAADAATYAIAARHKSAGPVPAGGSLF